MSKPTHTILASANQYQAYLIYFWRTHESVQWQAYPHNIQIDVTQQGIGEMAALFDYSILGRTRSGNYFLHELLRVFSAEKLAAQPTLQQETIQRHTHFYLSALARYDTNKVSAEAIVQRDIDNIRIAWRYAIEQGNNNLIDSAIEGLAALYSSSGFFNNPSRCLAQ